MAKVFLGLGTNLGDKRNNLLTAVKYIEEKIGKVTSLSSFYATEPWGFESENQFLNAAICVETSLEPLNLLHIIKDVEIEMGRTLRRYDYGDRGTYYPPPAHNGKGFRDETISGNSK